MSTQVDLPVDYPSPTSSKALTIVSACLSVLALVTWIPSFGFPTDDMSETFSAFATASMMWVAALILAVIAISNEHDRIKFKTNTDSAESGSVDPDTPALVTSKMVVPVSIVTIAVFPISVILFLIIEGSFL